MFLFLSGSLRCGSDRLEGPLPRPLLSVASDSAPSVTTAAPLLFLRPLRAFSYTSYVRLALYDTKTTFFVVYNFVLNDHFDAIFLFADLLLCCIIKLTLLISVH